MGKSTINGSFSIAMLVYQRVIFVTKKKVPWPATASPGGRHDLSGATVNGIGVQGHVHQVEADAWKTGIWPANTMEIPWKYHRNTMENWDLINSTGDWWLISSWIGVNKKYNRCKVISWCIIPVNFLEVSINGSSPKWRVYNGKSH